MTYKDLYNFMQNAVTYAFSLLYESDYEFEAYVKSMNPFYNVDSEEYFNTYKKYVDFIDEDLELAVSVEDSFSLIFDFLTDDAPESVVDAFNAIPRDEYISSFLMYDSILK